MAIFGLGKKKASNVLEKQFKDFNVTLEFKDNKYTFELVLPSEGYSLYPYFTYNEDNSELAIVINLRNADGGLSLSDYDRINTFNSKSKYLTAKISSSNILFLEYVAISEPDKAREILTKVIESVFMLSKEIDEL